MVNYSTDLKTWGSVGSEYPDGYSQAEGEEPVAEWHNYLFSRLIEDSKHLISLTNERIESGKGTSRPPSPENSHLFSDEDDGVLEYYDSTISGWKTVASRSWVRSSAVANASKDGRTEGSPFTIHDTANNQDIARLKEGGNVEIPNGNTLLRGNVLQEVGGTTDASSGAIRLANATSILARNSGDSGDFGIQFRSSDDVNVTAALYETGNRVATRNWVGNNYGDYSWTVQEGRGSETNTITSGETLEIYGGTDVYVEMDSNNNLEVSHAGTSGQGNVSTGGSTVIDDIGLDSRGHVTNLNTENRSLDDWNSANSHINIGGNDINNVRQIDDASGSHRIRFNRSSDWIEFTDQSNNRQKIVTQNVYVNTLGAWLSNNPVNNLDADMVDGKHASDLGGADSRDIEAHNIVMTGGATQI